MGTTVTTRARRVRTPRFAHILESLALEPVLLDVGAAGAPPSVWDGIADQSIYIGFDPDSRDLRPRSRTRFGRSVVVNKALAVDDSVQSMGLYLTHAPHCSSTLPPDQLSLANYAFVDLFEVQKRVQVAAVSPRAILAELGISRVDWFKTDSQGTDLRLLLSLGESVYSRVLAVDMEPGLIDAYVGEDLFVEAHRHLTGHGFWLSNLQVRGSGRIHSTTQLAEQFIRFLKKSHLLELVLKRAPGWCEVRYLRSVDYLSTGDFEHRDYALLAVFALLDGHAGFALDVTRAYETRFGKDSVTAELRQIVQGRLVRRLGRVLISAALGAPGLIARRVWRSARSV